LRFAVSAWLLEAKLLPLQPYEEQLLLLHALLVPLRQPLLPFRFQLTVWHAALKDHQG
jgi:hypothetical protein